MHTVRKQIWMVFALFGACSIATVWGQTAGPFTTQQAEAGKTAYATGCSGCHATDLGGNEAPQLAGSNFFAGWGTRAVAELVTYIQKSMPPANPGSVSAE